MPRAESQYTGGGDFDRSALPWGVLKALLMDVEVLFEEDKFPDFKKVRGIDLIFKFNFMPTGHKYSVPCTVDVRIKQDADGNIIVDDNKDTPLDERVNVSTLHNILTQIGYNGGLQPDTSWCDCNDELVNYEDIEIELNSFIANAHPEILVFVEKYRDKDGGVRNTITNWAMAQNNQAGLRTMNRKMAKKILNIKAEFDQPTLAPDAPTTPTQSSPKPGKRF